MNTIERQTASNSRDRLPDFDEMYRAFCQRDSEYEGIFVVGVKTTGIFCRPSCPARKPKPGNVAFFCDLESALQAGFRPCKKCRPLQQLGQTPPWVSALLKQVELDPSRPYRDSDLREMGIQPVNLRRWFKARHGITFQAYLRSRRMGMALDEIKTGKSVTSAAVGNGYLSASGFREAFKNWIGTTPADVDSGKLPLIVNRIATPLGPMVAVVDDDGLWLLEFADRKIMPLQFQRLNRLTGRTCVIGQHDMMARVAEQMAEYFSGKRTEFQLPLHFPGTEFQERVWEQLLRIPYGDTCSYDQLAHAIDKPNAQRAVGRANGDNRLAIVIPCHRVIRSDGTLSGYGGGVHRKRKLLDLERGVQQVSLRFE